MLHASGEFDDTSYKAASEAIDTGLIRAMAEKKEVDSISSYLGKLETTPGSIQQAIPIPISATTTSQSNNQALILHVRED